MARKAFPVVPIRLLLQLLDVLHGDEDAESSLAAEESLAVVLPVALRGGSLLVEAHADNHPAAGKLRGADEHHRALSPANFRAVTDVHLVWVGLERRHAFVLLQALLQVEALVGILQQSGAGAGAGAGALRGGFDAGTALRAGTSGAGGLRRACTG